MKKIIYSLLVISFIFSLSACKKSNEKLIIGKWVLEDVVVENIDEIVKNEIDKAMVQISDQLTQIDEQIAAIQDEAEKTVLMEQKKQIESQKAYFTQENLKTEFQKQFNSAIGAFSMLYNEDKSFEFAIEESSTKGTWTLSEDGKTLTTTNDGAEEGESVTVEDVNEEKMTLVREEKNENELPLKIKMIFKK